MQMDPEEFRRHAHTTVDWIADFLREVRELPVVPPVKPGDVAAKLPASAPDKGEPMEAILKDFRDVIVPGTTQWNHPRFFAYFSNSASGPGILGEMLAAALNSNHMLWQAGPAATELEQVTLGWIRQWIGLPETFFGIIHDTASTSTLYAILAAREAAAPEWRRSGEVPPLVLYCSEHAHSSVDRGALATGIGLSHIRHVPTDSDFRMIPAELARMVATDNSLGLRPFCVVATVGTTSMTSVDPVREVGQVARDNGLWLHVDAAYAGPTALLDEYREILDGAEHADSLVLNPHKWLFTPVDLSILYLSRPEMMRQAVSLTEVPAYLSNSQGLNLSEYSVALGRRFRSLKLWFVLRYFGKEGIAKILREHIRIAHRLTEEIGNASQFELCAPTRFSLVCFRYKGTDDENRRIMDQLNASGFAFISATRFHGKLVLRLAIGNIGTTWEDVAETWTRIQKLAREL